MSKAQETKNKAQRVEEVLNGVFCHMSTSTINMQALINKLTDIINIAEAKRVMIQTKLDKKLEKANRENNQ